MFFRIDFNCKILPRVTPAQFSAVKVILGVYLCYKNLKARIHLQRKHNCAKILVRYVDLLLTGLTKKNNPGAWPENYLNINDLSEPRKRLNLVGVNYDKD